MDRPTDRGPAEPLARMPVPEVQAAGRLVEDVDAAFLSPMGGELEPLPLVAVLTRARGGRSGQDPAWINSCFSNSGTKSMEQFERGA